MTSPAGGLRRGGSADQGAAVVSLIRRTWLAQAPLTAAQWATSFDTPQWYATVNQRRRKQVDRVRELTVERLKQEIAYWEAEGAKAERGEYAKRRQISRPWQEVNRLKATLDHRLAEFEEQESIQPNPPRILAVAAVIPQGLLERLAGQAPVDTSEVERRAVDAVMAAERRLHRQPEEMEPNNPGYDIQSLTQATGEMIFIEVKGRIAGAKTFRITMNEVAHAQNTGATYRLALVDVSPLGPEYDVVRYVATPFYAINVTTLVKSLEVSWVQVWADGRDPF